MCCIVCLCVKGSGYTVSSTTLSVSRINHSCRISRQSGALHVSPTSALLAAGLLGWGLRAKPAAAHQIGVHKRHKPVLSTPPHTARLHSARQVLRCQLHLRHPTMELGCYHRVPSRRIDMPGHGALVHLQLSCFRGLSLWYSHGRMHTSDHATLACTPRCASLQSAKESQERSISFIAPLLPPWVRKRLHIEGRRSPMCQAPHSCDVARARTR